MTTPPGQIVPSVAPAAAAVAAAAAPASASCEALRLAGRFTVAPPRLAPLFRRRLLWRDGPFCCRRRRRRLATLRRRNSPAGCAVPHPARAHPLRTDAMLNAKGFVAHEQLEGRGCHERRAAADT